MKKLESLWFCCSVQMKITRPKSRIYLGSFNHTGRYSYPHLIFQPLDRSLVVALVHVSSGCHKLKGGKCLKGCLACANIPASGGVKIHGRGITELEAKQMLSDMEVSEQQ